MQRHTLQLGQPNRKLGLRHGCDNLQSESTNDHQSIVFSCAIQFILYFEPFSLQRPWGKQNSHKNSGGHLCRDMEIVVCHLSETDKTYCCPDNDTFLSLVADFWARTGRKCETTKANSKSLGQKIGLDF